MPEYLQKLRDEHRVTAQVLQILDSSLAEATELNKLNFNKMRSILAYFSSEASKQHHLKEENLVQILNLRDADATRVIGDIQNQHRQIDEYVQVLSAEVANSARATEDISNIIARAQQLCDLYKHHIDTEENYTFRAAEWSLKQEDWLELEKIKLPKCESLEKLFRKVA